MNERDTYPGLPSTYTPRVHVAEVTAVARVGAGMVRVTLGGPEMSDYPTTGIGDEYVRLFFPDEPDEHVRLPFVAGRGWDYPEGVEPSVMRTYTIRAHRPGSVDVDFVSHEGGVAAAWAAQARVGHRVGLTPPIALYDRPSWARRQVLLADEPALPAALRIAELTGAAIETTVIAEVPTSEHQLGVEAIGIRPAYVWLRGSGNGRAPSALVSALRRADIDQETYVWVAGETRLTRDARKYLRHERRLAGEAYKCVGYWTDHAEEWEARYEQLGKEFHDRLDALYASEGDAEEIADQISEMYETAGL